MKSKKSNTKIIRKKAKKQPSGQHGGGGKKKTMKPRKKILVKPVKKEIKKKKAAKPVKKKIILIKKKIKNIPVKKPAKKKIPVKKAVVKKTIKKEIPAFDAEALFKAKIKVIGIGGGGGSIVSEIGRSLQKANFVVADTDFRALKKKSGIKYFWFGENLTHGLGTGLNTDLAREAAESDKEKISKLFVDQDIVILISSLGGGLGSGAAKVFAEAASAYGAITLGIFTLPFKFEGKKKTKIAYKALQDLKKSLNVSITIPNERIFKIINNNTPITEAFSIVNKNLIESLESLIDLIYNPGLINIDFADLRTILKGKGNMAFLNTAEESGKNKTEELSKKILFNPLYQNNTFTAEKILFNISGGQSLSMFDVEKISRSISDLNPKAKIIFGISKNSSLKNKIKATLLMTGPGKKDDAAKMEDDVVEKSVKVKEKIVPLAPEQEEKQTIAKENVIIKEIQKEDKIELKKIHSLAAKKEVIKAKPPVVKNKKPAGNNNLVPVLNKAPVLIESPNASVKKAVRRNALEIKKAEAMEEDKRLLQEKEWEIPAFLRRVKFKS